MGFAKGHQYTQSEVDFIEENYKKYQIDELLILFNSHFNCEVTKSSLRGKIRSQGLRKRKLQDNYGLYTEDMIIFLKENRNRYTYKELTKVFNKRFNSSFTTSSIWHKLYRSLDGLIVRTPKKLIPRMAWKKEHTEWLKANYESMPNIDLARQFNELFNTKITSGSLEHKLNRMKLKKDPNKIKIYYNYNREHWFKKGYTSPNHREIGSELADKYGNVWVKVGKDDIRAKHRLEYEKYNGPIPENMNIVFLNGNRKDFRKENLIALTNEELCLFNSTKIRPHGDDTIGGIKLVMTKLNTTINKKKKGLEDGNKTKN